MAILLAATTSSGASADFTLAVGEIKTIYLYDAGGPGLPGDAQANIDIKSDGGEYFNVAFIEPNHPAVVLQAPGTFRVRKNATNTAVGIGSN